MDISILKNWRVALFVVLIVISVFIIAPWNKPGLIIKAVDEKSDFLNVLEPGDIIYRINEKEATVSGISDIKGFVMVETSRGLIEKNVSYAGLYADKRPSSNIRFGLDLEGGLLAIVEPVDNVSVDVLNDIKAILEKRMSSLRESSFQIITYENRKFIQVQIAGGTESDLKKIINTTGVFEAKIPLPVAFANGSGVMKFGDESEWVTVSIKNDTLTLLGKELRINDSFVYKNVSFEVWNITKNRASIAATVYVNDGSKKDVAKVHTDPQHSYVQSTGSGYIWRFDVEVTPSAAEVFHKAVKNLAVQYSGSDAYLESKIYLYLDGKEMSNLSIGATLRTKPTTSATVSGGAATKEEALNEKRFLQNVLQSGALPSELKIVSIETITPKLGENFIYYTGIAFAAAIITVSSIIFFRYRNFKVSLMVVATCLSEIILILASSVVIGWTLDLAAIAGIMAVVGTGVDQQIMIVDEIMMGERTWSIKSKIKRAFFIVFGSAGTVLAAMLPLMILGFGMLRGFAITTSLGVLIAIFITRPAFTAVVEKMLK